MRHFEQFGVPRIFYAIALQRSQIVRIPEFGAQLLEDFPVALRTGRAYFAGEVLLEIVGDLVVIEERIVYVKKEDDFRIDRHRVHANLRNPGCLSLYSGLSYWLITAEITCRKLQYVVYGAKTTTSMYN